MQTLVDSELPHSFYGKGVIIALNEIFANREHQIPDVFQYSELPSKLRGQLVHILEDLRELDYAETRGLVTDAAYKVITREVGRAYLSRPHLRVDDDLTVYISDSEEVPEIVSVFEIYFRMLERAFEEYNSLIESFEKLEELVEETNQRFLRAGVGYQYANGQFFRIDSTHLHKEVVLPALSILAEAAFAGANVEYRKAHNHFREQDYGACLNECLKTFESMMKSICSKKGWNYQASDTASKLVQALETNGLFPPYMTTSLNYLTGLLTSTVPTVRNKQSGHGAGAVPLVVKEEYAAFCLHSTAADILLLSKLEKQLPDKI